MKFIFSLTLALALAFISIVSPLESLAACLSPLVVKLETQKTMTFCAVDELMVSKNCSDQKEQCQLLKDLKLNQKKLRDSNSIKKAQTQNPGSFLCRTMNGKVLMGEVGTEGSQICTCQNEASELVICTTLMNL